MEVDPPTSSSPSSPMQSNSSTLKRSNSAPMINLLVTSQPDVSPQSSFKANNTVALRRLSSSNMMLNNTQASTSPPIRGTDRVARIKQEEIHIADRERQHEREIQSSFWISNNWDHLSLDHAEPMDSQQRRPRSFSESLHIMTQSNILCGSPSPTRTATKQCFSPSMQIPVKNTTFTPSPSPSPTRKNFMRSLSPIAVRTGGMKRKLENDGDRWDHLSPAKKFNTGPSTPDRLMTHIHPLAHSISSSSLEGSSPEQASSRSSGSAGSTSSSILQSQGSSLGMRSPYSMGHLGTQQQSPMSSSGAPSPLSSGGRGHGAGPGVPGSFPAHHLPSKPQQGFMFLPVSETMGSPSSSTSSSSSSSSSSSLSVPSSHQVLHHNSNNPHPHHHSSTDHSPLAHQVAVGLSPNSSAALHCLGAAEHHHHHHHHSLGNNHSTGGDIYMSDSEMRDHSSKPPAAMEEEGGGYNFKPISPDHGS